MPQTSLLLPTQPTSLATLVVAAVTAVAIIAGSLIVIGNLPEAPVKSQPAATAVGCDASPSGQKCRAGS